jgi:S-adenosylmethionine hydrolase
MTVAGKIQGSVVSITATGSLVTDLTADQLRAAPRDERTQIRCDEHFTQGLFPSNHGEPEMTFLAILDDSGPLQLEIVGENASLMLGIRVGQSVSVEWA